MAVLAAAALLDELMGRNRNIAPDAQCKALNWEDAEFCKYFLVKFCPHDLFVNTRADLGQCTKIHDEEARKLYQAAIAGKKLAHQEEFIRFCTSMVNEVDRKILKGKQRLALTAQNLQNAKSSPISEQHTKYRKGSVDEPRNFNKEMMPYDDIDGGDTDGHVDHVKNIKGNIKNAKNLENLEKAEILSERINKLVEEAETCGIRGDVEQAQGLMKLCDQLKEERDKLLYMSTKSSPDNFCMSSNMAQKGTAIGAPNSGDLSNWSVGELAASQEKVMEVCEVCGAFLIVGDAQQRIDDHLMGKQHVGYARLKAAIIEIQAEVHTERRPNANPYAISNSGGINAGLREDRQRHNSSGSVKEKRCDRDRERGRDRERERDRADRDRSERNGRDKGVRRQQTGARRRSHHEYRERERVRGERDNYVRHPSRHRRR